MLLLVLLLLLLFLTSLQATVADGMLLELLWCCC